MLHDISSTNSTRILSFSSDRKAHTVHSSDTTCNVCFPLTQSDLYVTLLQSNWDSNCFVYHDLHWAICEGGRNWIAWAFSEFIFPDLIKNIFYLRFNFFVVLKIKVMLFWDVTSCNFGMNSAERPAAPIFRVAVCVDKNTNLTKEAGHVILTLVRWNH